MRNRDIPPRGTDSESDRWAGPARVLHTDSIENRRGLSRSRALRRKCRTSPRTDYPHLVGQIVGQSLHGWDTKRPGMLLTVTWEIGT